MRRILSIGIVTAALVSAVAIPGAQYAEPNAPGQPAWAYAITPPRPPGTPAPPPVADDGTMWRLPETDRTFTRTQIRDQFGPADWYPNDHPAMPDIVAKGRREDARACGMCHYPNGKGRPENAGVAGLPLTYFIQQIHDFRNDLRKSAEPRKTNTNTMIEIAKALTDDEIQAAAEYFASMKWTPWIRVVETAQVPKMRSQAGMWLPLEGAQSGMEPIGQRVIETPENVEWAEKHRSPRHGFIAYVPVGSVAKGQALVQNGDPARGIIACTVCHGGDLHGIEPNIPSIAARSPSYMARQLFDFQQGTRNGSMGRLMKPVVANMTNEDFVNVTAYLASLPAQAQQPTFTTASN